MLRYVLKDNPQKIEEENHRLRHLENIPKERGINYNYPTADFEDGANQLIEKVRMDSK